VTSAPDRGSLHVKNAAAERDALLLKESDLDSGVERRLSKAEAAIDRHETVSVKDSGSSRLGSLQERTIGIREEAVTDDGAAEASGVTSLSDKSPSTVECQQAVEEEANADRATEPSQQLFHLRRALRLCPEDARFHVALGKTYASMKRDEDASFEFREALRIDSSYAPALQALEELNKKMQDSNQH
jgi:tetratricopeptide (TPR) repeat protein